MEYKNKIGFITGGLGIIGLSITKAMLRNGLKGMTVVDVRTTKKDREQELLAEFGSKRVLIVYVDITKPSEVKRAFKATIEKFKHLEIVINNAGIYIDPDWQKIMAVNYIVPYQIIKMCMETYLRKYKCGDGLIINISSIGALVVDPATVPYASSKNALLTLGRCHGNEEIFKKYKIKFITICPGATKARPPAHEVDQGKLQTSDDLAASILQVLNISRNGDTFLCESKRYVKVLFPERLSPRNN